MNPEEKPASKPIKSLRTYQGDVEEALSKNKGSTATIMIAEQVRKEKSPELSRRPVNLEIRNKTFILSGAGLFFLGLLIVGTVYYVKANEKISIEQKTKALIAYSVEHNMVIASSTRDALVARISSENESFNLPPNSVLYLNTTSDGEKPATALKMLSLLAPRMPSALARSFEDKYMIGIYSFDTNEPFIIMTTKDFPASYAGMLKWEKDMPTDLAKIFSLPSGGLATTSSFTDEALRNKDLRVLRDANRKSLLLYSFIDKNTLVITANETIFNSIIGQYQINQQSR